MLGFELEWDFECIILVLTQIGVVLGLDFIAKQRSGFGFDYMSFALMRGNNPRTLQYLHVIKLVTRLPFHTSLYAITVSQ